MSEDHHGGNVIVKELGAKIFAEAIGEPVQKDSIHPGVPA